MSITVEEDLKNCLSYDPPTGVITWVKDCKFPGREAGHATKRGHRTINRKGVSYQAHQVAWLLYYGVWPASGIDHESGQPEDNRANNLRDADQAVNNKNKRVYRSSSSGVLGVSWCKLTTKWRAYININKRLVVLGRYDSFIDAVAVRKAAERQHQYHPNHGRV